MSNDAVINFLFNSQDATNGINRFRNNFTKTIDEISSSATLSLGALGATIGSAFSIKGVIDTVSDYKQLSATSGTAVSEISKLVNVFRLMGESGDDAESTIGSIGSLLQGLSVGSDDAIRKMGQFGDALSGITENDTPATFLEKLRKNLQGKGTPQQRNALLNALGINNAGVVAYLNKTDDEMSAYQDKAETIGVITQRTVERVTEFRKALGELQIRWEMFGAALIESPVVKKGLEILNKTLEEFNKLSPETQSEIMGLIAAIALLSPSLAILKAAVLLLTSPITWIIAIIAAVAIFRDDIDEALKAWNNFASELEKDHPLAGGFLKQLLELVNDVLHPVQTLTDAFDKLFTTLGIVPEVKKDGKSFDQRQASLREEAARRYLSQGVSVNINGVTFNNLQDYQEAMRNNGSSEAVSAAVGGYLFNNLDANYTGSAAK